MDLEYFDIHSHLHFKDFDADREEVISEMKEKKIATVSVGVDFETSKREVELTEKHENIFACIGYHPEDATNAESEVGKLEELINNPKVVAVGECGLDYYAKPEKNIQKKIFESQINLALKYNKPLMVHIRPTDKINFDAYKDTFDVLENYKKSFGDKLQGDIHFFVGNLEMLKKFLELDFSVSFAGVITFAGEYDEVIKYAPLEKIMSETDSPFVAPVPYRGKRNSPLYVPEIVKKIAEIRGESLGIVKKTLVDNATKFFSLTT